MQHIIARHLSVDMYNCKPSMLEGTRRIFEEIEELITTLGFSILSSDFKRIDENNSTILILLKEGHFTTHLYSDLNYVAVDFFLCDSEADPEKLFRELRNLYQPEKTKTTYLKRGDFGTIKDMKPTIKTKTATFRRIHNTGARVIRMLAHRRRNSVD